MDEMPFSSTFSFTYCRITKPQKTMLKLQLKFVCNVKCMTDAKIAESPSISAVKYEQYGISNTNTGFNILTRFVYLAITGMVSETGFINKSLLGQEGGGKRP